MSASKRAKIARLFAAGADGVYRAAIEAKVGTVRIASHVRTAAADTASGLGKYVQSESFETDIDCLIEKLQLFDSDLTVPDLRGLRRAQRINRKVKLVRGSFKRLNIEYAPIGAGAGVFVAGPKGAVIGAQLGVGIFVGCVGGVAFSRISEIRQGGDGVPA
ncbi:MAG: hypothetical protein IPJ84_15330 [Bdellovibrionales bacterium]|nr:hypothetical protein [Bdellovibrionales bacterium]